MIGSHDGPGEGTANGNRLARLKTAYVPEHALRIGGRDVTSRRLVVAIRCAVQGLIEVWKTEANFRLHVLFGVGVTVAGVWCGLTPAEWLWISLSVGLVIFAELMNTAIERLVDLAAGLSPNPAARFIKDVTAGAVLVCALLACVVGWLTFIPHLID